MDYTKAFFMAECKVTKSVKVVLYLNEEETRYLEILCQNSIESIVDAALGREGPLESDANRAIREGLYVVLTEAVNKF